MLYNEILILCGKSGISIARLEREAGLGNGTIGRWRKSSPSVDKLKSVADYFGVPVDRLLSSHNDTEKYVQ